MENLLAGLSVQELERGYRWEGDKAICNLCGASFQKGEVYPAGDRFFDAERAAMEHVAGHGGAFSALLGLDRRYTGLTGNQAELLKHMHKGLSDASIAQIMGLSASTVRHQRFLFREKAKQARVYLALFNLSVGKATPPGDAPAKIHAGATMVDDRYQVTRDEEEGILKAAFSSFEPLVLAAFPGREKKKIVVLRRIAQSFSPDEVLTEKEVSQRLRAIYPDFATLRRYLIEYGFLTRNADGSCYRLAASDEAEGL